MSASVLRRFAGSFQFLTVLPIHGETSSPGDAAVFFPLTGAVLGAFAGVVAKYGSMAFGASLGSLAALACLLCISGGLHEDGLADVADAIRAGRSRERMLEILKDSRIGTYGASALILFSLLRWQSIESMAAPLIVGICVAVGLSRASMVVIAGCTAPVGAGLGHAFAAACHKGTLFAVLFQSAVLLAGLGWYGGWGRALAVAGACAAASATMREWFKRRLGGVNGDCLGATCVMVETAALLVMACQKSF
ncbi:MAG: adenosylcobinamide-GDP ribazoletransferase [Acidobacteriaceae bacterium]|nr:adenosylcobinamide-GDP ribazoletransferase [Acidobacteriaceae bacterium]